uniref:Alkylated DNA repair protein AlkB homologue 8 N-terminal domain-containing protein n=2 Tax=Gasterosteus aculeatus aculeatus TaxID=481459 RepID=A0AAQ4S2X5_GASAC
MVVDFRRNRAPPSPITLCDSPVTIVDSFRFRGSIITQDLKWELNISSITKKAQQRLFFLRQLKKLNLPKTMMVHFYTAIMESILCSSITVWYAAATAKDKGRLQRVLRSAERVIGCNLPSLQDLFASRSLKRAKKIAADPSHPGQKLFVPLPSGRRLRSIRTTTSRHTNSFFPSAVGLINRAGPPLPDYNTPPVTPPHTAHATLTAIHHFVTCHFVSCLLLVR